MTDMVPAVNPADLKSLWRIVNLFQVVCPSGSIAIKTLQQACREGADTEAIWFRAKMLSLMPGMLAPWTHNDELDDVVFKIAAAFPMYKIKPGVALERPPFDAPELLKEIEQAARA